MNKDPPPSIYFGGCGYGLPYYLGVYQAMRELWGPDFPEKTILCGDGVGSLMAIGITLKYTPEFMKKIYFNFEDDIFENPETFEKKCLLPFLIETKEALEKTNDNCLLGMTKFFSKHIWRTHWDNEEELLSDIRNSMHIPILFRRVQNNCGQLGNYEIVDGTYSLNGRELPHGNDTLCVGIDSTFEISVPLTFSQQFFLQRGTAFKNLYDEGYHNCMRWDGIMNPKTTQKKPNFFILFVLWFLKLLELLIEFAEFYKEIVL